LCAPGIRAMNAPAAPAAEPLHPGDVLVLDASPSEALWITRLLASRGHAARPACSAAEGRALARARRPALVLLDAQLPDLDALRTARALADGPGAPAVPVLLLLPRGERPESVRFAGERIRGWLQRPLGAPELTRAVESALAADVPERRAAAR